MSSGSSSRASSVGPSSFTENLTMYMNGQRDPIFPIEPTKTTPPAPTASSEAAKAQIESIADGQEDLQTLRDELQAALERHNQLVAENRRLRNDLSEQTLRAARVEPLEKELNEARASLDESIPQIETAQRQLEVHRLRNDELEQELSDQSAQMRKVQEQASAREARIDELQQELEQQDDDRRDELDDQSTIEELEDDLERTQHELDKAIKDRQRVERQLESTKGDYEAEKQRVEELKAQLIIARKHEKDSVERESVWASQRTTSDRPLTTPANEPSSRENLSRKDVEEFRAAMERAGLRIDGLESQLEDARFAIRTHAEEIAATTKQAEQRAEAHSREQARIQAQLQDELRNYKEARSEAQKSRSTTPSSETPMDRAEAYIRKLKTAESKLKRDLQKATEERDELRLQLREAEDVLKKSQQETVGLAKQVNELQDIKDRMGRVLMYQWGKDEVGEIQKSRGDGKMERGMGFKYKYFNKDGSAKRA